MMEESLQSAESQEAEEEEEEEGEGEGEREREEDDKRLCDSFLDRFYEMMKHENVRKVLSLQDEMLGSLEVTNEKLLSLNGISEKKFQQAVVEFRQHSRTIVTMKKELDSVFRRIRSLKARLASQYPEAYAVAESQYRMEEEED